MSDAVKEANAALQSYISHGVGAEGAIRAYSESGAKYDEYMVKLNYSGPKVTAKTAAGLLRDSYDARILDVCGGTGLVAEELAKLGYKNIDVVDASSGLLEVARSKNLYKQIVCQYVGHGQPLPFEENTYDVAVICGATQENHIPKEALNDIIRVVKPGGYIVNIFREAALRVPWYEGNLEPYMNRLEKEGLWQEVSKYTFPDFVTDVDGLVLIHKIL